MQRIYAANDIAIGVHHKCLVHLQNSKIGHAHCEFHITMRNGSSPVLKIIYFLGEKQRLEISFRNVYHFDPTSDVFFCSFVLHGHYINNSRAGFGAIQYEK